MKITVQEMQDILREAGLDNAGAGVIFPWGKYRDWETGLDTHAFVPQCQCRHSELPSQLVFYYISKHFTATCNIPSTST